MNTCAFPNIFRTPDGEWKWCGKKVSQDRFLSNLLFTLAAILLISYVGLALLSCEHVLSDYWIQPLGYAVGYATVALVIFGGAFFAADVQNRTSQKKLAGLWQTRV